MSILKDLVEKSSDFTISEWLLDRDQDSDFPDPSVYFQCRISVPVGAMSEDDFDRLDNGFRDPQTGTQFYNHDSDLDDDHQWGSFAIYAHFSDIPLMLDILTKEVEAMRGWLTTIMKQDIPEQ